MAQRELYIDRLRTAMTAMVVFAHAAMTYGANGSWFYREVENQHSRSSILLTLYVVTCNAFLMGFFFLLAGYFAPASLERKGYSRFIVDRCLRLGIPLLTFGIVIAPLTMALVAKAKGHDFRQTLLALARNHEFINGPMWFAQALLLFSVVWCLWQALAGRLVTGRSLKQPTPVPRPYLWFPSAFIVGLSALLLRQIFPVYERYFGLWLGNFASYIFLFALGLAAWRHNWLSPLNWRNARASVLAACIAWPILPFAVAAFTAAGGNATDVRGFAWPNVMLAFWEPLVAWGLIAAGLLWFRAHLNRPSAVWNWLGRRAFTVYLIHPLTLVCVALFLRHWYAPALVKCCVTGTLGCAVTWLAAEPFVRLPGLRHIL